jgi:hypothetical protein
MLSNVPLKSSNLSLYIEDEQAIAFNFPQQTIFTLAPISVSLLLALDENFDESLAVAKVAECSGLSQAQVKQSLSEVIPLFSSLAGKRSFRDGLYPELKEPCTSQEQQTSIYAVGGTCFDIHTTHYKLADEVALLLAPCRIDARTSDINIAIVERDGRFDIVSNKHTVQSGLLYEYVMPELIDRLQILAFQRSDTLFCFHGAALQMAQGGLLMPGESGAGKSTLTAYLASLGAKLYSDEMIALNDHFQAMAIQLPIAIKAGSWPILKATYPELNSLSVWRRLDGRQLKYVWPTSFATPKLSPKKVMLICPQYQDSVDLSEPFLEDEPLSVIDTLTWLVKSGYQITRQLEQTDLAKFITYLNQLNRYIVRYSSNEQAEKIIKRLWEA